MEQQIVQLVSGIEVRASERLMIVRFLDAISFNGEESGTQVKEVCKLAFEPELALVLMRALEKFLAGQAEKKDGS